MKKVLLVLFFAFSSLFAFEDLTKENFDQKIANGNVLVDFHAIWWGTCKVLERNLTKYNTSNNDTIKIKLDDYDRELILKSPDCFDKLKSLSFKKNITIVNFT